MTSDEFLAVMAEFMRSQCEEDVVEARRRAEEAEAAGKTLAAAEHRKYLAFFEEAAKGWERRMKAA